MCVFPKQNIPIFRTQTVRVSLYFTRKGTKVQSVHICIPF